MESAKHASPYWLNIFIAILGSMILILGIWGYAIKHGEDHAAAELAAAAVPAAHPPPPARSTTLAYDFVSWVYESVQIALFHTHFKDYTPNPQLQWAMGLAMCETIAVTAWGVLNIFPEHLARILFQFRRGHVVVCGLNRRTLWLVHKFRGRGVKVAVIEKEHGNPLLELCRKTGALIFIGDATKEEFLREARVHHARHLVAFSSKDGVNVDIACAAGKLLLKHSRSSRRVDCHIHIVDFALWSWLRRSDLLAAHEQRHIRVRMFDCFEISARMLLRDYPLDYSPIRRADDPRRVHLIVAGFGQMGEAVVLQAAKECHLANLKRMRVTIIDRDAREKEHAFLNRYPQFGQVCDFEFLKSSVEDARIVDDFKAWCSDPKSIVTVAVCFDNDSAALGYALSLRRYAEPAGIPIRVRMGSTSGLSQLLSAESRSNGLFTPFGMIDDCCTPAMTLDEELDRFARDIHKAYCEFQPGEPWEKLDPDLRDSNVQQSMHYPVKLRAVNCILSRAAPDEKLYEKIEAFTTEEVEKLARMEHLRWNAERFLNGWTLDRSLQKKDLKTKRTPYLVAWEELTEEVQGWDKEMVLAMPRVLKFAGYGIYRKRTADA